MLQEGMTDFSCLFFCLEQEQDFINIYSGFNCDE